MNQTNTNRPLHNFSLFTISFSLLLMFTSVVSADFSRDGDIVTDSVTGLEWQDDESVKKSWEEAIEYCEALELGGHTDWRLPSFNELYTIADHTKKNPAIDAIFQAIVSAHYWSSTTIVGNEDYAWHVYFYDGYDYWDNKSGSGYVRCVRARQ